MLEGPQTGHKNVPLQITEGAWLVLCQSALSLLRRGHVAWATALGRVSTRKFAVVAQSGESVHACRY